MRKSFCPPSLPPLFLSLPASTSPRMLVPMAVNISFFLSNGTPEAHVTCSYLSFPPVYPWIKVNGTLSTVSTLNKSPALSILDCYNDMTMVNVLTIVLHNPRLYVGTVFECSFLLHGGGIVTSGPATVTLTPAEGSSPPQCIEEVTRGSCI